MTEAAAIKEATAISEEALEAFLLDPPHCEPRAERRGARRAARYCATLAARSTACWCRWR